MARPKSKENASATNLWLSDYAKREGSKVAYQFHGQDSLSGLVEKLLKREIARRMKAAGTR